MVRPEADLYPRVSRRGGATGADKRAVRREIAADLGDGLWTLRNWISGRREGELDHPPAERQAHMVAELKRLRRENEVLRQEHELLKRTSALFAKEVTSVGFRFTSPTLFEKAVTHQTALQRSEQVRLRQPVGSVEYIDATVSMEGLTCRIRRWNAAVFSAVGRSRSRV